MGFYFKTIKKINLKPVSEEVIKKFNDGLAELLKKDNLFLKATPYFVSKENGEFTVAINLNLFEKEEVEEDEVKETK